MVNWLIWVEKSEIQPTAVYSRRQNSGSRLTPDLIDSDQPFERKLESLRMACSPAKPKPSEVDPIACKQKIRKAPIGKHKWNARSEIIDLHLDQLQNGAHAKKDPSKRC
jgi:hypothetical protein